MDRSIHLAVVQFKPRKGDYATNLARLAGVFSQIESLDPRPDVAVFAETALTGYFVEGGVRDVALTTGAFARDLQAQYASAVTTPRTLDVCIGFYEVWNNAFYNSALYVTLGGDQPVIRHVHRKLFLPTYGMFDEERFVDRGFEVRAFDTPWGRAAMLICEDAWHSLTGTVAALDGATMVFIVSASPARGVWPREDEGPIPANLKRWERLARDIAEEHGVFVALVNLVGTEGGKSFTGGSIICGPHGEVRARAPLWDETIMSITLDPDDVTRARSDTPLLTDLQTMMPHPGGTSSNSGGERHLDYDDSSTDGGLTPAGSTAMVNAPTRRRPKLARAIDPGCEQTWKAKTRSTRKASGLGERTNATAVEPFITREGGLLVTALRGDQPAHRRVARFVFARRVERQR
jgi:predicted amidohydrolase